MAEKKKRKAVEFVHDCLIDGKHFNFKSVFINHLKKYDLTFCDYLVNYGLVREDNYIKCPICNHYYGSIPSHLKESHREITLDDFKISYPNCKIYPEKYLQNLSISSSGENNGNHKSKTTEEERKSRSPFSKNFVGYDKLTENEKESKLNEIYQIERKGSNTLEWWLKKGYTLDESKLKLKERQTTFTLEKCIQKYGIKIIPNITLLKNLVIDYLLFGKVTIKIIKKK